MSFSREVKEELSRNISTSRHCQIAEIAAILSLCGRITISDKDQYSVKVHTENIAVARKCFTLLKKTFNIDTEISIRQNVYLKKSRTYTIVVKGHEASIDLLSAVKLLDQDGDICENMSLDNTIVMKDCCKRAYIRGAFLATGSISNPNSSYHFEIVCATMQKAKELKGLLDRFQLDAKIVARKKHFVVYIKEGSAIVDALNIMEAHVALMNLENIRILKEMRNSVNRKVNCETANLNKTIKTAYKQIEDIKYIERVKGLSSLSETLEEVALVRLDNPEASLQELGTMLDPPVGKSGVNHRLRKISEIAQDMRQASLQ